MKEGGDIQVGKYYIHLSQIVVEHRSCWAVVYSSCIYLFLTPFLLVVVS